jgi:hypothetical protein
MWILSENTTNWALREPDFLSAFKIIESAIRTAASEGAAKAQKRVRELEGVCERLFAAFDEFWVSGKYGPLEDTMERERLLVYPARARKAKP